MTTNIRSKKDWFAVLETGKHAQTAVMTLEPGESSGEKMNEHPQSEQVLFLVEGELEAEIGERRFRMKAGDSAIVPTNLAHRFSNPSEKPALTFNVYSPPAY